MGSNLCYLCSHTSWSIHWDEVSLTGAVPSKKIGFPSVGCHELLVASWLGIRIHEFFIPLCWNVDQLDLVQFLYRQPQLLWVHEFKCPVMTSTSGSSSARWFLNSVFCVGGDVIKRSHLCWALPLVSARWPVMSFCIYCHPVLRRNILIQSVKKWPEQGHFYMLQSIWKSTV